MEGCENETKNYALVGPCRCLVATLHRFRRQRTDFSHVGEGWRPDESLRLYVQDSIAHLDLVDGRQESFGSLWRSRDEVVVSSTVNKYRFWHVV